MRRLAIRVGLEVLTIAVLITLKRSSNGVKAPSAWDGFYNIYLDNIEQEEEDEDDETTTTASGSNGLDYDFYRNTCPQAESIVRSKMAELVSNHRANISAALLRLFFHDCFVKGCDASIILNDSNGDPSNLIERQAVPNRTLKGFDIIDLIKEEVEKACPGVVSCADILALATRDGILLVGGPFYPVFTGRRDSIQSYYHEATAEIPSPDGNITETLRLFGLKGFDEKETVSLLGAHNIGRISCEFIQNRLYNFLGTGQPDPSVPLDFLYELRINCQENYNSSNDVSPTAAASRSISETNVFQGLTSISSGAGFDNHFYQRLVRGRGLLFSDQQLMVDDRTASFVMDYAFDNGSAFRIDFARAMVKMSILDILSGSQGQIRTNCSIPLNSS